MTSDPNRIDQLFNDAWREVYNRPHDIPPPNWEKFKEMYAEYAQPLVGIDDGNITAQELIDAVKRMKNGAAGLDGWSPAEFKLLPSVAWEDRVIVEACIFAACKYPDPYYFAPIVMLRKGEGLEPKDNRGITILLTSYRLSSAVWWQRISKPLTEWVHPGACGGLPATECMLAAWDSQLDFELAVLEKREWSQINCDYDKFFDKFDPRFFHQLNLHIGIPRIAADLFLDMYLNIQRRFRIGTHIGETIKFNRGGGQGDSLWLMDALLITTIQLNYIQAKHPTISMSSVIDDRNFRGPTEDVINATLSAIEFDHIAGMDNNMSKFAGLSTTADGRNKLRDTLFDGKHIRVTLTDKLIGTTVTTLRAPRRGLQDQRINDAIAFTKPAARSDVGNDLKTFVASSAAIPKIVHGTLWVLPSADQLRKMRTAVLYLVWGFHRSMRCAEVVLAVLNTACRVDPVSAIVYTALCDTRRILGYSIIRFTKFYNTLRLARESGCVNIQGPANGFSDILALCGARYEFIDQQIILIHDESNTELPLLGGCDVHFKRTISDFCTRHLMSALISRTLPNDEGEVGRKDMYGITPNTDHHATLGAQPKDVHKCLEAQTDALRETCTNEQGKTKI